MDPRGQLYRDPERGDWRGRITIAGRRRYVRGRTQREARARLDALIAEAAAATDKQSPTLRDWTAEWLDWCVARERPIANRTLEAYTEAVRLRIVPWLGDTILTNLTPAMIRQWHRDLARRGGMHGRPLGPATVHQAHRTLATALARAVEEELIDRNVARITGGPSMADVPQPKALTRDQAARLLEAVRAGDTAVSETRLLCSVILGLRQAEALGLTVEDVDLDAAIVTVHRQRTRTSWTHGPCMNVAGHKASECPLRHRGPLTRATKTRAGVRRVPIPDFAIPVFQAHIEAVRRLRNVAGSMWDHDDPGWLFPGELGAPPSIRQDSQRYRRLLERVVPDAARGTHAGRRGVATAWAEAGIDRAVIRSVLGWSDDALIDHYARPSLRAATQASDLVWGQVSKQQEHNESTTRT